MLVELPPVVGVDKADAVTVSLPVWSPLSIAGELVTGPVRLLEPRFGALDTMAEASAEVIVTGNPRLS